MGLIEGHVLTEFSRMKSESLDQTLIQYCPNLLVNASNFAENYQLGNDGTYLIKRNPVSVQRSTAKICLISSSLCKFMTLAELHHRAM